MKIALELFHGKTLADGKHPVLIRVTHQGKNKYKSTGVSCYEKHWNNIKKRITCRASNYKEDNVTIYKLLKIVNDRANYFFDNNYDFDLDYILSDKKLHLYKSENNLFELFDPNNFVHIIKARIESYTKVKTRENYQAFYNVFVKFYGENVNTNKINQVFSYDFRKKIDDANYSSNHKNGLIKCFTSTYKFACENRWIENPYPITIKKYEHQTQDRNISDEDLTKIINDYKKYLQTFDFDNYKCIALFILDVMLQGLAPLDLATIKISDLQFKQIQKLDVDIERLNNDLEYANRIKKEQQFRNVIVINTYRHKTNIHVPICCDFNTIAHLLYYFCKGKTHDDYLIDCFKSSKVYDEKQLHNRCGNYFMVNANALTNKMSFGKRVTYYVARHSFINRLDKMNIEHSLIRKMIGHKQTTIEKSYLYKPTEWEQSEINFKMFNQIETINNLWSNKIGEQQVEENIKRLQLFLQRQIEIY